MATGSWEYKQGKWKPQGISTHNEPEPLRASGFLLYFEGADLHALALQDGDKLYDDKVWHLIRRQKGGEKTLQLGHRLGAALTADLVCQVEFRYTKQGTELKLTGPLATMLNNLADFKDGICVYPGDKAPSALAKVSMSIDRKMTAFVRSGTVWVATNGAKINVPGSLALAPESIPIETQWIWNGCITGYFTIDADQASTVLQAGNISSRLARQPIGLTFADDPPESLSVHSDWQLFKVANLHFKLISATGEPISLQQYIEVDRRGPVRWSHPRRTVQAHIQRPSGWEWPSQLFAVDNRVRLVASLKVDTPAWGFGPADPLFAGSGHREELKVRIVSVTGNGLSLNNRAEENLARNRLPIKFKATDLHLVFDSKGNYGPFITATDIPPGTWTSFDASSRRERLISWRGFADIAELVTITGTSGPRSWLRLRNGFPLKPEMWCAAPFAGIAMYPDSMDRGPKLWGTLHDCEDTCVRLHGRGHWSVAGQWLALDPDNKTVKEMAAFAAHEIDQPLYLVLFNGTSVERVSGPVLKIEAGTECTCPILAGWLTDTQGSVDGLVAPVELTATSRSYRLPKGGDIQPGIPAEFRAAFDAAMNEKQRGEGIVDGIHWIRSPNQDIEAWAVPGQSGVFEHNPTKQAK